MDTESSTTRGGQVRVVLVDDHPIWRSGVKADLGENFWVVGEADDATSAIEVITATKPDLVVCDLHMPNGGGLKVARECGAMTSIVMLTVSEQERDLLDAVSAGANGYLIKSTPPDELRAGLWRAAQGEPVFSPALAALVMGEFRRLTKAMPSVSPLSEREREVLQLVADGLGTNEIAERLYISHRTVKNHLASIYDKLNARDRTQAVLMAVKMGIVKLT